MTEQNGRWRATYAPGTWVVLSGPTLLVVMPPAAPKHSELISGIWTSVVGSGTVSDLIESLARVRMERLPDFGAFFWAGGGMRALVRGAVQVRDAETGAVLATGEGMQTWAEIGLGDVMRFDVIMPGDVREGLRLPLVTGAVTAGQVRLDCTDEARLVFSREESVVQGEPEPSVRTESAATAGPGPTPDVPGAAAGEERPFSEARADTVPVGDADGVAEPPAAEPVAEPPAAEIGDEPPAAETVGEPPAAHTGDEPVETGTESSAAEVGGDEPSAEEEIAPVDLDLPSTLMAEPPVTSLEADYVPPSGPAVAAFDVEPTEVLPATSHGVSDPPTLADPLSLSAPAVASFSPPPPPGAALLPPAMPPSAASGSAQGQPPYAQQPAEMLPQGLPPQGMPPQGMPPQAPRPSGTVPPPASMPQGAWGRPQEPSGPGYPSGAAARPPAPQPGRWQPVSPAGRPSPSPYPAPVGPPVVVPPAGGPVISGLPSFGTTPPPATPAPASASEHDGETIFATGIAATHKAGSRSPAHADLVLAAMCNRQHPNPPDALVCARCGGPVDRTSPQLVTVPVLATLRASTGQTAELAGVVLVGRAPQAQPSDHDAELLTVPSPSQDISRTHLRVAAVQWEIVVTDLHSTNGTILVRPGDQPVRMVPGEPVAVGIGSVLDLGDGVVIRIDQPH